MPYPLTTTGVCMRLCVYELEVLVMLSKRRGRLENER